MSKRHRGLHRRRWAMVRKQVFDRDGYRCRKCGRPGRLECDHVIPLWKDREQDPYDIEGLQALCVGCHIAKTVSENKKPPSRRVQAWLDLVAEVR